MNKCSVCGAECRGLTCSGSCRAKLSRKRKAHGQAHAQAHDPEVQKIWDEHNAMGQPATYPQPLPTCNSQPLPACYPQPARRAGLPKPPLHEEIAKAYLAGIGKGWDPKQRKNL